ncbi:MAG TPA: HAMP domain-containing sensor histidine kinase [Candidatus Acidoferrales bacterium]|nr:HAMP domain-containing sensor histidine kinase [Candidatus Acidoferrales bacterium]
MSRPHISALVCGVGLLAAFALAPSVFPNPCFRVAMGDLTPLLAIAAAAIISARNAFDSRGHTRLFWSLMATGMSMWCFNQAYWVWFEVLVRRPVPDPYWGDVVLFLHVVPVMAAVAIRPHQADEREGMLPSALNVLILLIWWVAVYAFFVFPDEYIVTNIARYSPRWNLLYVIEGLILIAVSASAFFTSSGSWRVIYRNIFLASVFYSLVSEAMNAAFLRGLYKTGGIYDLPYLASGLGFFWVALAGRRCLRDTQVMPMLASGSRPVAPLLAKLALLSLPLMGYWALFLNQEQPYLRQVRFVVAMGGVALLAFVIFLQQQLLDQKLLYLLKRSRRSFDNLQRLQGRVIQQAKLASLGELVALAASELEFPLSAILNSSEGMAASSNLSREQLANAQKIGQQARRTRELVSDLLSFAQQTPGEKSPLELKPLLQRAIQMEGFKLENKRISLSVESNDKVPLPRVLGNANQLLQAFVQIVENAVDALQEIGGGRLQISLWREADEVVVQFADSGPGLRDPERVFDPFYTTKPVGKGTGLGLSATYGVIQDHKGQITCNNRPEGGAVFEIRLPGLKTTAPLAESARA